MPDSVVAPELVAKQRLFAAEQDLIHGPDRSFRHEASAHRRG